MNCVAAGSRVRHSDASQHGDAVSQDPSSPTSTIAAVTNGLRTDVQHHWNHHHHQAPAAARTRTPSLSSVQSAAAPPSRAPRVLQALPVFDATREASTSDFNQPPKVITVVNGTGVPRPRPNVKFLLNVQNPQTYEQFVHDVACALDKGAASTVSDGQPSVRLFTVRGREVTGLQDLFRDDDVFIGVGVGRNELSVSEVRQIFQELYPRSEYSEILVDKWMRARRRHSLPHHIDRTKHVVVSEVTQKPEETSDTVPRDGEFRETVEEVEHTAEVENESTESKRAGETAAGGRLEDIKTLENSESRLINSDPRLSQSLARPARVHQRRRVGSEPRYGKPVLPPLVSASDHPIQNRDVDNMDSVQRSRPRQRGRRHIRLPPLQLPDSSTADAEPTRKLQASRHVAGSLVKETTTSRHGKENRSVSQSGNDSRRSRDRSRSRKQSVAESRTQKDRSSVKTDENYNVITDVPHLGLNDIQKTTARSRDTARSEASGKGVEVTETAASKASSRFGKDRRRSVPHNVKMKTKFERQVSTIEHVTNLYEEGRMLGDGNFAVVKQCRHRESGREYAMKIIDKSKMAKKESMLENEIAIMKQCNHVNIVRLYEEYETKHEIYLIMELVKVSPVISLVLVFIIIIIILFF